MSKKATINLDMDKKCSACGKLGAADNGLCLECVGKKIRGESVLQTSKFQRAPEWVAKMSWALLRSR